ncbi:hypothetical protein ABZ807_24565 [Micromonospora sp. NPDC047548]|uniref:alpha/beta hydrolase family protein n=1 Tax=Micromonospora sp. NPDC047548 TaxID=3155624 RepID=UPI0033CA75D1
MSAYVCVPKGADGPLPAVFCHHQHAGQFHLGKSEVVGLAGHPDQAYARELAERGFVGHSYGGRTALWAPAFDHRITASVSHYGCIPYRYSFTHDTGLQAEFVLPGFAAEHDLEDVVARFGPASLLISTTSDDRWSRGAEKLFDSARGSLGDRVELAMYEAGHVFTPQMRDRAYAFLHRRC